MIFWQLENAGFRGFQVDGNSRRNGCFPAIVVNWWFGFLTSPANQNAPCMKYLYLIFTITSKANGG